VESLLEEVVAKGGVLSEDIIDFNRAQLQIAQQLKNSGSKKTFEDIRESVGHSVLSWEAKNRFSLRSKGKPVTDFSARDLAEFGDDTASCVFRGVQGLLGIGRF
jgi:hypothetical protein